MPNELPDPDQIACQAIKDANIAYVAPKLYRAVRLPLWLSLVMVVFGVFFVQDLVNLALQLPISQYYHSPLILGCYAACIVRVGLALFGWWYFTNDLIHRLGLVVTPLLFKTLIAEDDTQPEAA